MPRFNTYDPPLISALVKFHQWAKAHRINYAVLGGIAVGVWGKPRATLDLDVLILFESAEINKFSALAQQVGYELPQEVS